MPELANLREADLYNHLPASSIKKGFTYLNAIFEPVRSGDTLTGVVLDRQHCQVEVEVMSTGLLTSCTCDSNGRGCKHCAALLLKWIRSPDLFKQQAERSAILESSATPLRVVPVSPPPTSKPKELPDWLQTAWSARVQLDRQELEGLLNMLRLDDLRALARNHGWSLKGTRKADIVTQIIEQLLKPEQLTRLIGQLDQEHRQAFWAIAVLGAFPTLSLEDMERVARFWGKFKQQGKFSTYVRHLSETGLVLTQEQIGQYAYGLGPAVVPPALARLLPPLLAEAMPAHRDLNTAATNAATAASGHQLADPEWLVHSVTQLLVIFEQTTPPLRPPMPRPYREKALPHLQGWDYVPEEVYAIEKQGKQHNAYHTITLTVPPPAYPFPDDVMTSLTPLVGDANRIEFLYQVMVAVGLLQPGSPVTVWPEVKEQFLRQPVAMQQAILARTYFHMTNWSELWPLLRAEPQFQLVRTAHYYNSGYLPQNLLTELAVFRTLVLAVCAWLPDDHWFPVTDLLALLRQAWPQFNQMFWQHRYYLIPGQTNRGVWHLTYRGQALDSKTDTEWQQAQGNFVRALLSGALHWAGLVDLYHEAGQLVAVRFHGLGDLYLDRTAHVTLRVTANPEVARHATGAAGDLLHIDGDQIRVEPARITVQAHSLLDRMAVLEVAQPQQFVYRLDAGTVQKSFEAGLTLTEMLAEWEARLSKPMPAAIKKRLTTWWKAYGQLRLYQDMTIIEFGDDHALAEMKAVTNLNAVLIAEISPRLVLIPQSAIATLAAELEKAGYTPQQTETTE